MGGGASRLDETDWENGADGCLTGNEQTIDGGPPTLKYQLYELQKQSVGQRAFDVVDANQNVILTTQGVSGTLSWFDVLGPHSIGDYKDLQLRVQADMSRRTWMVYRYHTPVFEGQKAANEIKENDNKDDDDNTNDKDPNEQLFKGVEPGVKLYKTACITVSWSRYVAVSARYGPPSAEDFLNLEIEEEEDGSDSVDDDDYDLPTPTSIGVTSPTKKADSISSNAADNDPLFSKAHQIAARSRERTNTGASHEDDDEQEELRGQDWIDNTMDAGVGNDQNTTDEARLDGDAEVSEATSTTEGIATKPDKIETSISLATPSSTDALSPTLSIQTTRSSTSTNPSPSKRYTGPKRPATTLTELGASHSRSSGAFRRTSVRTQKIRDYFSKSTTSTGSGDQPSPRFGSRLFKSSLKSTPSEDETQGDSPTKSLKSKNNGPTQKELYELALEGVIDLDNQPIVQCQEISSKLLGNHQTFNMTKEQLFQLLRLDEEQHEEQLHQEGEAHDNDNQQDCDDSANPMVQAMEHDATHTKPQAAPSRPARWMSSIRGLRVRGGITAEADDATATTETVNGDEIKPTTSSSSLDESSSTQGRFRSSFNRLFTSKSAEDLTSPSDDMVLSVEKSLAAAAQGVSSANAKSKGETEATNGLDRYHLPSLLDESKSPLKPVSDNDHIVAVANDQDQDTPVEAPSSPAPGSGVEECKTEAAETPDKLGLNGLDATESKDAVGGEVTQVPSTENEVIAAPVVDHPPHPHPLVGYWFWKHTTFNFGQHKMYMHLAKNSDLALHLILSIIVNQVRSERNHTIFATTGLHPALFFIDPKNPKAILT